MFTIDEFNQIRVALMMAQKSAQRLSNREGQPVSVAVEYRAVIARIGILIVKVDEEIKKLPVSKK